MLSQDQQQIISSLFTLQPLAVIATADAKANPSAAVVLFSATPDLDIIFATHPSRKYHNLKQNPKATLVFTKDWQSVQMFGIAKEMDGPELESGKNLFMAKHPEADQHLLAGSVFFKFSPAWIRFTDTGAKPAVRWEVLL